MLLLLRSSGITGMGWMDGKRCTIVRMLAPNFDWRRQRAIALRLLHSSLYFIYTDVPRIAARMFAVYSSRVIMPR